MIVCSGHLIPGSSVYKANGSPDSFHGGADFAVVCSANRAHMSLLLEY